jgi:hypothetical protein
VKPPLMRHGQFASLEGPREVCMDAQVYCAWSQLVDRRATSHDAPRIRCRSYLIRLGLRVTISRPSKIFM